jgi:hypothetical protein
MYPWPRHPDARAAAALAEASPMVCLLEPSDELMPSED